MRERVLVIFEGEKRESEIWKSFSQNSFFPFSESSQVVFGSDIYQLWSQLSKDKDIDLIGLLQERGILSKELRRESFSSVYLFFDYDPHSQMLINQEGERIINRDLVENLLLEMLHFFNNETENGKLFISYPMVEALRPCVCYNSKNDFLKCSVTYDKVNKYKQQSDSHAQDKKFTYSKISNEQWSLIVQKHCVKINYLLRQEETFPLEKISQEEVFSCYKSSNEIYSLSAFPLLLLDYYGATTLLKLLKVNDL